MAYGPHDNPQPDWHQFRHWSPAIWSERRGRSCRIGLPRTLRQRVRLSYCPGNSAAVERLAEEAGGVGLHAGDDVLVFGNGQVYVAMLPGAVAKDATCSIEAWPDVPDQPSAWLLRCPTKPKDI